jgi:hypothetical protein
MAAQVVETIEIFSNDLAGTSFLTGCQNSALIGVQNEYSRFDRRICDFKPIWF